MQNHRIVIDEISAAEETNTISARLYDEESAEFLDIIGVTYKTNEGAEKRVIAWNSLLASIANLIAKPESETGRNGR